MQVQNISSAALIITSRQDTTKQVITHFIQCCESNSSFFYTAFVRSLCEVKHKIRNLYFSIFIGPRSDHSLPMSLTNSLTNSRPCSRFNELTSVDGIKYLSNILITDIEMKLRFSCQQLVTSGKAGNSCNSCQSWQQ